MRHMKQLLQGAVGLLGAWLLAGCAPDPRLAAHDAAIAGLVQELRELKEDNRRLWRNQRCTNQQVADFMADAARCETGQCPQKALDRVLLFMMDQKHVLIRLRPDQKASDMALSRIAQLRDLLHPDQIGPLSRLVVLTLQNNMSGDDAILLPEKVADRVMVYARKELGLAPKLGKVGPFLVTCDQKSQLLEQYARRNPQDKAVLGEPKPKDPQVAIFVFKVDC